MTATASARTVAFLGLGRLGNPMARRLLACGHHVTGFDPSAEALAAFAAAGGATAGSPAEAAAGADVVCVMVRDDAQALDVVTGADGVLTVLAPGSTLVVHSTVAPDTVEAIEARARERGIVVLDAGISGGPDRAATGTLVVVCGGDAAVLDGVRPVLEAYASDVIHCGAAGTGMAAKLARNLAQYGVWCALFEGVELAEAAGVDPATFARYVRLSGLPANHEVILGRPSAQPEDVTGDPARAKHLRWAVELGHKDLDDAFELADRLDLATPIGRLARQRYGRALGLAEG